MYINPFLGGILATLLAECALIIILAFYYASKKK